jgi:hypothetical protein
VGLKNFLESNVSVMKFLETEMTTNLYILHDFSIPSHLGSLSSGDEFFPTEKDHITEKLEGSPLPGTKKFKGDEGNLARGVSCEADETSFQELKKINTTAITQILVEEAVDPIHDPLASPEAVGAIACLPGRNFLWGSLEGVVIRDIVPRDRVTQLVEDTNHDQTSIERGTAASKR